MLTEVNLHAGIHNGELGFENYLIYRTDRSSQNSCKQSGGGTLVAVKSHFHSHEIIIPNSTMRGIYKNWSTGDNSRFSLYPTKFQASCVRGTL